MNDRSRNIKLEHLAPSLALVALVLFLDVVCVSTGRPHRARADETNRNKVYDSQGFLKQCPS